MYMYSDDSLIWTHLFSVDFSGLLNGPSVQEQKSVPALFVRISKISGLMNHHCMWPPQVIRNFATLLYLLLPF